MRGPSLDPWTWTPERERAAQMVANGQRSNDQIAVECGVSGRSLRDWKSCPEFGERVRQYLAEYRAKLSAEGLALKSNRIALLMARAAMIRGIIRARGKHQSMANAPGTTVAQKGIQIRTLKSLGGGDMTQIVEEFAVDIRLLDQECDYLQHIATELGEWKKPIEHGGKVAASPELVALCEIVTVEEFATIEKRRAEKAKAKIGE